MQTVIPVQVQKFVNIRKNSKAALMSVHLSRSGNATGLMRVIPVRKAETYRGGKNIVSAF